MGRLREKICLIGGKVRGGRVGKIGGVNRFTPKLARMDKGHRIMGEIVFSGRSMIGKSHIQLI